MFMNILPYYMITASHGSTFRVAVHIACGNDERGKRDTLMRDVELTEVEEDAMVMLKGIRTVTKHTRRINAWV